MKQGVTQGAKQGATRKTVYMAVVAATLLLAGQAAQAQQQTPAAPRPAGCADDPLFSQQDFTLGTWDVYNGPGETATRSAQVKMEKVVGGCGIYEVWTPAAGRDRGHGRGLFAYSRVVKGWQYFWISDAGDTTLMEGALIGDGHIRYITEYWTRDNRKRINHWDLIRMPDGRVREFSVISDDLGLNWRTEYDLYWKKVD